MDATARRFKPPAAKFRSAHMHRPDYFILHAESKLPSSVWIRGMTPTPISSDENRRLEALRRYGVLDTPPELALDDLTALAAKICETPIALVSLVDAQRQWFKSKVGITLAETPRDFSFCANALGQRDLFIVPDAAADARFRENPLVTGAPGIRFYAGAPLLSADGYGLGTLCVIDLSPRVLTETQQNALRTLGRQVMLQLELRRQQRELAESEARFRIVTEGAEVGLAMLDEDRVYTFANEAYARILELPQTAIVGARMAEVLADIFEEQIRPRMDRAFAGERVSFEVQRPTPNGVRHCSVVYEPRMVDGLAESVVAVITDITERKNLERERAEAEALRHANDRQMAEIVQGMTEACCALDTEFRFTFVNSQTEALLQQPRAKMIGQTIWDVFPHLRETITGINCRRVMAERVPISFEVFSPAAEKWLDVRIFPSSGGIAAFLLDIHARKMAEEALRQSEARLREGETLAKLGNWEWNSTTGHLYWSSEIFRIYGRDPNLGPADFEEVGKYFTVESWDRLQAAVARTQQDGSTYECEVEVVRGDGSHCWTLARGEVRLNTDGKPDGLRGTVQDITERKLAALGWSRLAAIVESSDDAIISKDLDGIITSWNRGAEKILGYCADEIIGSSITRLIPPDRRDEETFILGKIRLGEGVEHFETVRLAKDGRAIHVSLAASPIRSPEGSVVGVSEVARDITERKRAEAVIRGTTDLLRAVTDGMPDAIFIKDLHGRYLLFNEGASRLAGRPIEFVLGKDDTALFNPDDARKVMEHGRRVLESGQPETMEIVLTAAGATRTYLASKAPYRDERGNIIGLIGISHDITERKRMELALGESMDRFRTLFEYAPAGILIGDRNSIYLDANPAMCRMLGYSREELIGKNASDIIAPAEADDISPTLDEIHGGENHHREWQFQRKDRTTFPVDVMATVMPDGNILAIVRDITERKNAETAIHETRSKLEAALASMTDAVCITDATGHFIDFNEAFATFHRFQNKGECATTLAEYPELLEVFFPNGDQAPTEMWAISRALRGEIGKNVEYTIRRKDTGETWVGSYSFSPMRNRDGAIVGSVMVGRDMTERKKLEQQFFRAQRMESIGTLAGGIAHDLNNALSPIMMSLAVLQMRFPDRDSKQLLDIISASTQRGADLVRQVLSFARGVEGRRTVVQLKHLVGEIEKIATDTFLKHIRVQTDLQPDLWSVTGDSTQLHQVLMNLCVNARDAMPGGGTLAISGENITLDAHYAVLDIDAKPGPYVFLQVEDTGSGIAPELIDRIFDPFFTTKEVGQGTGLGLSTSLAIVKAHGGFIRVASEIGSGTNFQIYLPAETEGSAHEVPQLIATMPTGNGELILVVDDEASVRSITQQTLETFGYRVMLASDGAEAVANFARHGSEIAVVLTDMMMPVMDGSATIRALRKMEPSVRIIAASGVAADGDISRATNLGVKYFLPKPFTAETLLKTLREVLTA